MLTIEGNGNGKKKRPRVMISRISRGLNERVEIGTWMLSCWSNPTAEADLIALDIVSAEPTSAARNMAVRRARSQEVDILIMVDDDMIPAMNFYDRATRFLQDYPGPTVFASPYCGAAPLRSVQVVGTHGARYTRDEAANRHNIEQVVSIGTGLFACNMACFDVMEKAGKLPWFDYEFVDEPYRSQVASTEDIAFCNALGDVGGRIFCDWESWSGHAKVEIVGKPTGGDQEAPGSHDIFDATDLYAEAVRKLPIDRQSVAIEVGCYLGRSVIALAQMVEASGKPIKIYAVDHFRGSDSDPGQSRYNHRRAVERGGGSFRAETEANLRAAGVFDRVKLLECDSALAAGSWAKGSVDFCFIDASHDEESVERDVMAWLPRIRPGGILAGHDYNWPSVKTAVLRCLGDRVERRGNSWWYNVPAEVMARKEVLA